MTSYESKKLKAKETSLARYWADPKAAYEKLKIWRAKNPEKMREHSKRSTDKRREKISQYAKQKRLADPEFGRKQRQRHIERVGIDAVRAYQREWHRKRRAESHTYRIEKSIRARIYDALKFNRKAARTAELIGCSIAELIEHLQSQFHTGMTWENYGKWHIDHKKPCSLFDMSDHSQQRACFNYTNLQPLWGIDNVKKKAKYG